jgi:hypothetical protein
MGTPPVTAGVGSNGAARDPFARIPAVEDDPPF